MNMNIQQAEIFEKNPQRAAVSSISSRQFDSDRKRFSSPKSKKMEKVSKNEAYVKKVLEKTSVAILSDVEMNIFNDKCEVFLVDEDETIAKKYDPTDIMFWGANRKLNQMKRNIVVFKKKRVPFKQRFSNSLQNMKTKIHYYFQQKPNPGSITWAEQNYVFSPDGNGKLVWDLMCMLLIFYEIISIPFKISFEVEINVVWEKFIMAAFLTDILLTFNTAIYIKGNITYSRRRITLEYFKLWFWLDLLASFPYSDFASLVLNTNIDAASTAPDQAEQVQAQGTVNAANNSSLAKSAQLLRLLRFFRFLKVIRLLRLAKLKVIFEKIEYALQLSTTIATIMSFIQLSGFVLFWSHWIGCIFHFVGMNEDPAENWLVKFGIYEEDWSVRYVNSIYWAVTTMITVGYGDISPQTPLERLCGIFFLQVACGVFSFTLNTIGNTLQQINQKKQEYRKRMQNINKYMTKMDIPKSMQHRVRRYLAYIWDSDRPIDLHWITSNLSQQLKFEFTLQVNGSVLSNCTVIWGQFSKKFLIELTQIFSEQTILPDEFIFKEFEVEYQEKNIYFLLEGQINILFLKNKRIVNKLTTKNDYFGEIAFYTNMARTATAQSSDFADLFYISRNNFLNLLNKYPIDKVLNFHLYSQQNFHEIKDNLLLKNNYSIVSPTCYACFKDDHVVINCPNLHFIVNTQQYFRIRKLRLQKLMKQFCRKDIMNFNALNHRTICEQSAFKIQNENVQQSYNDLDYNLNDDDDDSMEEEIDQINVQLKNKTVQTKRMKSKFREDRFRAKKMKEIIIEQNKSLGRLNQTQTLQMHLFTQITSLFQGNSTALADIITNKDKRNSSQLHNQKYEDYDSEEETIQEKMQILLKTYEEQKQTILKKMNQDNRFTQTNKLFMIMDDFDKGADFVSYFPYNNLTNVRLEYENFNRHGYEARPKIETDYDLEVNDYLIDYYQIDQSFVMQRIQTEGKRKFQSRQDKKRNHVFKQPAVKKLQKITNIILPLRGMQTLKSARRQKNYL